MFGGFENLKQFEPNLKFSFEISIRKFKTSKPTVAEFSLILAHYFCVLSFFLKFLLTHLFSLSKLNHLARLPSVLPLGPNPTSPTLSTTPLLTAPQPNSMRPMPSASPYQAMMMGYDLFSSCGGVNCMVSPLVTLANVCHDEGKLLVATVKSST